MDTETLASPERRAFFKRFSQPAIVELPESEYPRPPWAQETRAFLSLCNRCNHCINRCPRRVLRPSEESAPVLQGLPVLSLDYGSCDFCGLCVDHCATGALSREQGEQYQAVAQPGDNCQRKLRHPCDLCLDACTEQAITLEDQRITVDSGRCTGCGECSLDCHSNAISIVRRG